MKRIVSKFATKLLSREDLKNIKGGEDEALDGCGSCITFEGRVLPCLAIFRCECPTGNRNNACG